MVKKDVRVLDLLGVPDQKVIDWMKIFISSGGSIDNLFGSKGQQFTMLQACAGFLKTDAVVWLLENGADPNFESSKITPLSMLVNNYFFVSEKDSSYWDNFRSCLYALVENGVDFDYVPQEGMKALFSLLDKEKDKIPEDVLQIFIDNTTIEEKGVRKTAYDLFKLIVANKENFTFSNISYLVDEKGINLNNVSDPNKSLVGVLSSLSEKDMKSINKTVERIHKKYGLDFNQKVSARSATKTLGRPIENVISKKNLSLFKMMIDNHPSIMQEKFGNLNMSQFCTVAGFTEGLKIMMGMPNFDWTGKDDLILLANGKDSEMLIRKAHMKHVYETMDKELKVNQNSRPPKRLKI